MRKTPFAILTVLLLALLGTLPREVQAHPSTSGARQASGAYELIDAVNALRAENGLGALEPNPALMQISQAHSEYQASIGTWTHIGADGSRPFQRALAAGYAVAGDLTQGGWFSENVINGIDMSAEEAVQAWLGDAPHTNTMLGPNYQDIGAGVAVDGNRVYYTIDVGLSTGGLAAGVTVVYNTPGVGTQAATPYTTVTVIPSTPNADGSIIHIVQSGETVWSIAQAYRVSEQAIADLNPNLGTFIYPGETLIISGGPTPTPTAPTPTATIRPTSTYWPTATPTRVETATPTASAKAALPLSTGVTTAGSILFAALLVAAALTLIGARNRK